MTSQSELLKPVAELIRSSLNLHHIDLETIQPETSLVGEAGLNLDSIDILELVVAVEKNFNIKIKNVDEGKSAFQSVGTLISFIDKHRRAS